MKMIQVLVELQKSGSKTMNQDKWDSFWLSVFLCLQDNCPHHCIRCYGDIAVLAFRLDLYSEE